MHFLLAFVLNQEFSDCKEKQSILWIKTSYKQNQLQHLQKLNQRVKGKLDWLHVML